MSRNLPGVLEATQITTIRDNWFMELAQRKRAMQTKIGHHVPFIAVFGSAMTVRDSSDWKKAVTVGVEIAKAGAVTMNGGYAGTMESASEGAASVGGKVIGVTCLDLPEKLANRFVTDEWVTDRWDQRMVALVWLADGYIICPGSSGTLVELSMVIETQLKGFLPFRPAVGLGSFWKPVVGKIIATKKIVTFVSSPKAAVQHAIGKLHTTSV